jgi:glycosyltransferase involved in cell wall biosynthesis
VLLKDTALALQTHGHDVHLVVYGYGGNHDDSGLRVHRSRHVPGVRRTQAGPSPAKPLLDLALVGALRRVIRRHRIDVTLAHNYEGLLVALAARAHPIVYHAHNAMADELPHYSGFRFIGARLGAWLDRRFPRKAAHAVAPHAGLAAYLVACGCVPARVSVLAPPALAEWFDPAPAAGVCPPVLYTGNLDSYQNVAFLHHVMNRVRAVQPAAELVVATNDRRPFPGVRIIPSPDFASVRAVLARDAVVVCPRISWSGYPIKLLNAMAAGKAIVACRSAAHPLEHERTGLVIDDNDEVAFADAVLRCMQSPSLRTALGTAARDGIRLHHSPERYAAALESIFARVVRYHKR